MKKILALLLASVMIFAFIAACADGDDPATDPPAGGDTPAAPGDDPVVINVWGWNDELGTAMKRFAELRPDLNFEINLYDALTDWDGSYEAGLNAALDAGGPDAPDVFFVESAFVVRYTQYDFAIHALPYAELLGRDVGPLIDAAQISRFIVDAGTNPDGEVVGLGFQSTGAGFIYRRDLAEQVWGDGSPEFVAGKIGSGSGNWDAFLAAAEDMYAEGIAMLSDMEDAWGAIRQSPTPWIQDGRVSIDAQRMSFLDIGAALYRGNFTNQGGTWNDSWFADMSGSGVRPVFGFLGPAWLINYVLAGNAGDTYGDWGLVHAPQHFAWGGTWTIVNRAASPEVRAILAEIVYWLKLDTTDTGFLYQFGGGTLYDDSAIDFFLAKDMVSSEVVQARLDGTLDFLDGQDMAPVFLEAAQTFTTRGWGPHDREINGLFNDTAILYFDGTLTRDEMIEEFKTLVRDQLGFES